MFEEIVCDVSRIENVNKKFFCMRLLNENKRIEVVASHKPSRRYWLNEKGEYSYFLLFSSHKISSDVFVGIVSMALHFDSCMMAIDRLPALFFSIPLLLTLTE